MLSYNLGMMLAFVSLKINLKQENLLMLCSKLELLTTYGS